MEAYPPQYVEHNLPLVFLSGLGEGAGITSFDAVPKRQESGARIHIESPECQDDRSKQLLQEFLVLDGTQYASNSVALPGPSGSIRYKMKTVGRSFVLPARKAAPQPQSPGIEVITSPRNTELHSPLSPLSPGSPIFPDGVFTPLWFSKQQRQVPCLLLAFFAISAGESGLQDEQLKTDILAIRSALSRSGFRTRFAAVLLSDKSIQKAPDLDERLSSIRKVTSLDTKTGLFFMPPLSSAGEIATFVHSVMSTLQPTCIEFYRESSKHARRRKTRGGPNQQQSNSASSNSSQSISASGWNVRYEVKQGVFAEFRQEMDVAERHYSAAIEELFSSEGVFETTVNWSPRWDEARLLCDILAIRVLRAQLWVGATTGASQSWLNYKSRMKDLIDRRGKGSLTYSWDAWEGRWAGIMSQLIQLADVSAVQKASKQEDLDTALKEPIYFQPERLILESQPIAPFTLLHHSGYWLRMFAKGIRARWEKAMAIPEEDRIPPGQSPASAVSHRYINYDAYLVKEPHEENPLSGGDGHDYIADLSMVSIRASEEFEAKAQIRMSEQVRFNLAEDFIRAGRYDDATQTLAQLWEVSTWREEEWHVPFTRLLEVLLDCIGQTKIPNNAALFPAVVWEALSLPPSEKSLDVTRCLDTWDVTERLSLELQSSQRLSPIQPLFAFKEQQAHVGDVVEFQLSLDYNTSEASFPITISKIEFELGDSTKIIINHESGDQAQDQENLVLQRLRTEQKEQPGKVVGVADMRFRPLQRRVSHLSTTFRDAQTFYITRLSLFIDTEKFSLSHHFDAESIQPNSNWYSDAESGVDELLLPHMDTETITVLPKPPKMSLELLGLRREHYTNERFRLLVQLVNEESEAVQGAISTNIVSRNGETLLFAWVNSEDQGAVRRIPELDPAASTVLELLVEGPPEAESFALDIDLRYNLVSDSNTTLQKTLISELIFAQPFDAKFTLTPLFHPQPWPSYFDPRKDSAAAEAEGIPQLWKMDARLVSCASEPLRLHGLDALVDDVDGDAICNVHNGPTSWERIVKPNESFEASFELTTSKLSLDDRRATQLDLSVALTWSHGDSTDQSTTGLSAPQFAIPTSEPRVLCTLIESTDSEEDAALCYYLENPSGHFLTFALTMEASAEFAFSGPKYRTLSLAPLSRHRVKYRIILYGDTEGSAREGDGVWMAPNLSVVDSYYQKNLRVYPSGKNVRVNENKEIEVWISQK